MKLSFMSNEANRCHSRVRKVETDYREAIRMNLEFSELKKIYRELKESERAMRAIMQKDIPAPTRMSL